MTRASKAGAPKALRTKPAVTEDQPIYRDGKLARGNPKNMRGYELRMYAARLGLPLHDCRTLGEDQLIQSCIQHQTNRINELMG